MVLICEFTREMPMYDMKLGNEYRIINKAINKQLSSLQVKI